MSLPDRIDFTTLADGRVIILKLRRDVKDPAAPRDIPTSHDFKPASFNLDAALDWCQEHGYVVRKWHGGARAWLSEKPWIIRTRSQIIKTRQRFTGEGAINTDFAFDG